MSDEPIMKADIAGLETRLKAHVDVAIANSRNTVIVWTVGAVLALGMIQHYFK
jgi:hypothetical protein